MNVWQVFQKPLCDTPIGTFVHALTKNKPDIEISGAVRGAVFTNRLHSMNTIEISTIPGVRNEHFLTFFIFKLQIRKIGF